MAGGGKTTGRGSLPLMVGGVRGVERARIVSSSHGVHLIEEEEERT
jgi:hypothetical protein